MAVNHKKHGLTGFLFATFKLNIQSAMEYRANFLTQVVGMFINDIAFLIFWMIVYNRFHSINGWNLNDVMMMQAIVTIGFGIASFFAGNWESIADVISKGGLDYYLVLPKPVLLHLLVTRSQLSGIGDALFGAVIAIYLFHNAVALVPLFLLLTLMSGTILVSFGIAIGSLTFFIGGRGDLQTTLINAVVTFSTYPLGIFGGFARLMLLTVIPVGFITGIPVIILKSFSGTYLLYMIVATLVSVLAAYSLFKLGLRHYESGNAINVQI